MSFFSLLAAFLFDQVRTAGSDNRLLQYVRAFALGIERNFNAGESRHGVLGWIIAVPLPVLRAAMAKSPESLRRSGFENSGHDWTVYSYAGPGGDIRFMKPGFGGNAEMDPEMLH